jgi:hyperosmotically inducible protein
MKTVLMSVLLATSVVGATAVTTANADTEEAGTYVKNSAITTKVKAKLASKHMSTLTKIKVNTDKDGVVWLSGTAPTKDAKDLAEELTKNTDGVTSVHNKIMVP